MLSTLIVLLFGLGTLLYAWFEIKRLEDKNYLLDKSNKKMTHEILHYKKENKRLQGDLEKSLMVGLVSVPKVEPSPPKQVQSCSKSGVIVKKELETPPVTNNIGLGDSDNNGGSSFYSSDLATHTRSNDSDSYSSSSSDYSGGGGDTGGGGSSGDW